MPRLLLGPLLRHVARTTATVWVQTDGPAEVEVLGHRARTFEVGGHHYALVVVEGLQPGTVSAYGVALDGEHVWPEPDDPFPAPTIRTLAPGAAIEVAWGSCRVALPQEEPYALDPGEWDGGRGVDALHALACEIREVPPAEMPHLLLWLGDQVYADEVPPDVQEQIERRDGDRNGAPTDQVCDFEEYTWLYTDSWAEPSIRWLLSTVASAMIFDDHDVHDSWNVSWDWVDQMRAKPWWQERVRGGLTAYWVYQHLGNLAPEDLERDALWARVREHEGDVLPLLREMAQEAERRPDSMRWSFRRDLEGMRLVAVDSRAARDLDPARRRMVEDQEWAWVREQVAGDFDHVVLASSVPVFVPPGLHWLEGFVEAVAQGAWGRTAARAFERIREAGSLDQWPAFQTSFRELAELVVEVAAGEHGRPPGTVLLLGGDVHNATVVEVAPHRDAGARSPILQAVCSPYRNPLPPHERRAHRATHHPVFHAIARLLGRAAGVADPPVRWRVTHGPTFDNQVAGLDLDGRAATLRLWRATEEPGLEEVHRVRVDAEAL